MRVEEESNDVNFVENMALGTDTCYDADTSNNSADYHMSAHEEVNQATLHRGFGEAAARGAKNPVGFYPINEETVFMDPPSNLMNTVVEPQQFNKWLLYNSSSSGDDYCCGQHTADDSAEDTNSDTESECIVKRNRQTHRVRLYENNQEENNRGISKRLRVKDDQVDGDASVDVRMIDFAHTTFGRDGIEVASNSSSTVHQGPDSGFITGLDSLKRLLHEIMAEG